MSIGKRLAIRARVQSAILRIRPPKPKPLILMYHRVADEIVDPWGLAVSPAHFEEQLCVLRRTRHPLPLVDFVRRLEAGTLPSNAVALTFDDGYLDNLTVGKPLLAAADVPATVFLATGYLGEQFWSDELADLILAGDGPSDFEIAVGDQVMRFDRGDDRAATEIGTMLIAPRTKRHEVLRAIWLAMRRLGFEGRRSILGKLRSMFSVKNAGYGRAMTGDEVRALLADGLVTIGAHTVTHPVLKGLDATTCLREITESKAACEALSDGPITTFAYPFGQFDAAAREAVKAAGLSFACATRSGPVRAESDPLALPRVHVPNVDGDKFERVLHWATIAS